VLGPLLDEHHGTSAELVRQLLSHQVPGCVRLGWAVVDVRDVAKMHRLAMTTPDAAGQRFICAGEHAFCIDVARVLRDHFGPRGYRVPVRELPAWTLHAMSWFDARLKQAIPFLHLREDLSHERASRVLGWKPRSMEDAVVSMGESLIRYGVV
jgi:nucleoside-diphosphate-sugar epimerase